MKGILYGVGVGPGDPELLTLQAVRLIRKCPAAARVRCGRRTEVRRRQTDRTGYCFAVHRAGQVNPAVRYADDARQAGAKCQPRRGGRCALCAARRGQDSGVSHARRPDDIFHILVCTQACCRPRLCSRAGARRAVLLRRGCCHGPRPVRGRRNAAHHSGHARQGGGRTCALRQQGADEERVYWRSANCSGSAANSAARR